MSATEKTLVVAGLARSLYGQWRLQRLLSSVIIAIGLIIVSAMLIGALLIGGLYSTYFVFLSYGIEPHQAMLFTGFAALGVTALILLSIAAIIGRVRRQLPGKSSATSRVGEVVDAFLDGLTEEPR